MAKRTRSAQKQARKSDRRRLRNRRTRLQLKDKLKQIGVAKSKDEAMKLLPEIQSLVDKTSRRRVIHPNTARRLKSRIAREATQVK